MNDQRLLDAFLGNYDKIEPIYLDHWKSLNHQVFPPIKWHRWFDGNIHHVKTDGSGMAMYEDGGVRDNRRSRSYYYGDFLQIDYTNTNESTWRETVNSVKLLIMFSRLLNRTAVWPSDFTLYGSRYLPRQIFDLRHFNYFNVPPSQKVQVGADETQSIDLSNRNSITDIEIIELVKKEKKLIKLTMAKEFHLQFDSSHSQLELELTLLVEQAVLGCDPWYDDHSTDTFGMNRLSRNKNKEWCYLDWRFDAVMMDHIFACADYGGVCREKQQFYSSAGHPLRR